MATITDMGIPGLSSGGTGLQPKLKDRWRIRFANIGGGGVDSQPLSVQCVTVARPNLSFTEVEINRYNSRAWVGSKHEWQPLTATIEDDVTGSASAVIQAQLQRQQWLIGAAGPFLAKSAEGSLYKFLTIIEMMDGGERVVERWICEGCWIKSANYGEISYNEDGKVEIQLEIRFDHAKQDIGGYNAGPGVVN